VGHRVGDGFGRDAGPAQACQRHFDAAFLGIACTLVDGPATEVVAVFGQVGQMAEVGEGADHADGLVAREAFEQFIKRLVGVLVGVAAKGYRQLAHLLDQLVGGDAILLANHIAEDATEQADVFHQGAVVVSGSPRSLVFSVLFDVSGARGSDHLYPLCLKLSC
jgi:succinyl-CoA synthetase alpha subunit